MKSIVIIVLLQFAALTVSSHGKEGANEITACRDLAAQLSSDLRRERGDILPTEWDDFIGVRLVKEGKLSKSIGYVEAINSLALVPGVPEISASAGISREYVGYGLLAISRHETTYDRAGESGRHVILAGPPTPNPSDRLFPSYFIPETTADVIFSQIPDFDPSEQPLAFEPEFIAKIDREKKAKDAGLEELFRRVRRDGATREKKDHVPWSIVSGDGSPRWIPILVVAICLSLIGIFFVVLAKRRRGVRSITNQADKKE